MINFILAAVISCFNPVDYGAIPNDGLDDRIGIQAAVDLAGMSLNGEVCLPAGRFDVTKAPIGSYNRLAAISTHRKVSIYGAGKSTVLSLIGDQGKATVALLSVDPGASDVVIRDLTLDTSYATNTEEQTHALQIGSSVCSTQYCVPIKNVSIERVEFIHPPLPGYRKGDCIRLLGNTQQTSVYDVIITDSNFTSCSRSSISVQRNVHRLSVTNSYFNKVVDTFVDYEPTGAEPNNGFLLSGCTFVDEPLTRGQGDYAVTVGGSGVAMTNFVINNNIFYGRGIGLYRVSNGVISGNNINASMLTPVGVINGANVVSNVNISNNFVKRDGYPGPLVRLTSQSGGNPSDIIVNSNNFVNNTVSSAVYFENVMTSVITNNIFRWTVSAPNEYAVYLRASLFDLHGIIVSSNSFYSEYGLGYGVLISSSPYKLNRFILNGNDGYGLTFGAKCIGTYLPQLSSGQNLFGPISC